MKINFSKYHGTGNDFILIDNRKNLFPAENNKLIQQLCYRQFGIGADGLILLEDDEKQDFNMKYFNSNGFEGSMCGNGGRCVVHFARELGIISGYTFFNTTDGLHTAEIENNIVRLSLNDVKKITINKEYFFLNTGSPHAVFFKNEINNIDVFSEGKKIRNSKEFAPEGTNVNFVKIIDKNNISIRTYERGVENETLSCGTGAVASAISTYLYQKIKTDNYSVQLQTKGGNLKVNFKIDKSIFTKIILEGAVVKVFDGTTTIKR
ncbi:MAG: diaminopimelate epimerase [Bacteroidota bacterium]|nr:diaminopimelate epimerase [Bacteroidota bacterium]